MGSDMIFEFSGCQGDIVQQGQGVSGGNTLLLRRLQNLTLRQAEDGAPGLRGLWKTPD